VLCPSVIFRSTLNSSSEEEERVPGRHATIGRTQLLFGQLHQLGGCLVDLSVCLLVTIACTRLLLVPKDSGSSSLQACDLPENLAGTVGPDLGMAATQATCRFGEAKGTKGQANASKSRSQVNSLHHHAWPMAMPVAVCDACMLKQHQHHSKGLCRGAGSPS
jgi:hypothetical protein